ncbi:hypothetical protein ACKAV7_003834 [Fusarium commune]
MLAAVAHKTKGTTEKKADSLSVKATGQKSIVKALKLDLHNPREQAIANTVIKRFDRDHFQRLLMNWIVARNHSFSIAEENELREIFDYLNPSVSVRDANLTHTTIKEKATSAFKQHKQKVVEVLRKAPGLIHISFDGWRDENNKPCKVTIGVPELSVSHTGTNIAAEILDVIEAYQIQDKIGYFTLDNAENNDTAVEIIGGELGFVGKTRRGRCFGHTLNLSAKSILFGHKADAFERQLSGQAPLSEAEHLLWQKRGPVGKLHNVVVFIHRSDKLTDLLREVQRIAFDQSPDPKVRTKKPLDVVLDNDTRWLSQLYMIRRALQLRDHIELLIARYRVEFEQQHKTKRGTTKKSAKLPYICEPEHQLSDKDWEVLEIFSQLLGYYECTIKMLEGDGQIRKRKRGWMGSYAYRWKWFDRKWAGNPEWIRQAKRIVHDVWHYEYRETRLPRMAVNDEKPAPKRQKTYSNPFQEYLEENRCAAPATQGDDSLEPFEDEYQHWISNHESGDAQVRDPLAYWHEKRFKYPRLSRMALDFLTIQPMSAECERLFSAAGRMVTPLRSRLEAQVIGTCQVLRSWLRAGIIRDLDPFFVSVAEEKDYLKMAHMTDDELQEWATAWLENVVDGT